MFARSIRHYYRKRSQLNAGIWKCLCLDASPASETGAEPWFGLGLQLDSSPAGGGGLRLLKIHRKNAWVMAEKCGMDFVSFGLVASEPA